MKGLSILIFALLAGLAAGQQAPIAGQGQEVVFSGRVVFDQTQTETVPIAGAIVTLSSGDERFSTISNTAGVFEFRGIAPGRYYVSAEKPPFIKAFLGDHEGRLPSTTDIRPGTWLSVTLKLRRGATVSGTVTDVSGNPIFSAVVTALRRNVVDNTAVFEAAGLGRTNGEGEFELTGLSPGDYLVAAQPAGRDSFSAEPIMVPRPDEWERFESARSRLGISDAAPPRSDPVQFATTYYPAGATAGTGTLLALNPGERIDLGPIALNLAPVVSLDGRLLSAADGPIPTNTRFSVITSTPTLDAARTFPPGPSFRMPGVGPGRYLVVARGTDGAGRTWWGQRQVDVQGTDLAVEVEVIPAPRLTMLVRVAEGAVSTPDPRTLAGAVVSLRPQELFGRALRQVMGTPGQKPMAERVDFGSVVPALYRVVVDLGPDLRRLGWFVQAVRLGDSAATGQLVDLRLGRDVEAEVILSDRSGRIEGAVIDEAGSLVPDSAVLILPSEPERRFVGSPSVIAPFRTTGDGSFTVDAVPAGQYCAGVLAAPMEGTGFLAPDFVEAFLRSCVPIEVSAGGVRRDVRIQMRGR